MATDKKISTSKQIALSFVFFSVSLSHKYRRLNMYARLVGLVGGAFVLIGAVALCSGMLMHTDTSAKREHTTSYPESMYKVADALGTRPGSTLVASKGMLAVLRPTLGSERKTFILNSCPSAHDVVLQKLQKQHIAVLVFVDNRSGKQQCTLGQIVAAYGRPNASTTISGSLAAPREVLLYYDAGPQLSGPIKPVSPPQQPATVVPITLATLPAPSCAGRTTLSFVAHQDDDLLFMNPDHLHQLRSGGCLRTVYLTAGDAGLRSNYWQERKRGAQTAYDTMIGHGPSIWIERYVQVTSHEYIQMMSPRGNPNVTLLFMYLPDGNVSGGGFTRTRNESLAKLTNGGLGTIHTVDGQSSYSKDELTDLLKRVMQYYHPDDIDTQTPVSVGGANTDHSDHTTTGQLVTTAYGLYGQGVPLKYYTGYPISAMPQNVSGQDLADKNTVFSSYLSHDSQICQNPATCADYPYTAWLMRQYIYTPGEQSPSTAPTTPPTTTDSTNPNSIPSSTPSSNSATSKTGTTAPN